MGWTDRERKKGDGLCRTWLFFAWRFTGQILGYGHSFLCRTQGTLNTQSLLTLLIQHTLHLSPLLPFFFFQTLSQIIHYLGWVGISILQRDLLIYHSRDWSHLISFSASTWKSFGRQTTLENDPNQSNTDSEYLTPFFAKSNNNPFPVSLDTDLAIISLSSGSIASWKNRFQLKICVDFGCITHFIRTQFNSSFLSFQFLIWHLFTFRCKRVLNGK